MAALLGRFSTPLELLNVWENTPRVTFALRAEKQHLLPHVVKHFITTLEKLVLCVLSFFNNYLTSFYFRDQSDRVTPRPLRFRRNVSVRRRQPVGEGDTIFRILIKCNKGFKAALG